MTKYISSHLLIYITCKGNIFNLTIANNLVTKTTSLKS